MGGKHAPVEIEFNCLSVISIVCVYSYNTPLRSGKPFWIYFIAVYKTHAMDVNTQLQTRL